MGDMADFALDNAFEEVEHFERYSNAPLSVQYDEGLINEHGVIIGNPGSPPFTPAPRGPHGEGACPKCGSHTVKRTGKDGLFYGCATFPTCKGSRGA